MKYFFAALLLISNTAFAYNESPTDMFTAEDNMTDSSSVSWIQVDDLPKTCKEQSEQRGLKPFKYKPKACSFWRRTLFGNSCVIYTQRSVNYHTMGHELRHCFQGSWPGHP